MELTRWLERCPLVAILRGVKPEEVVAIGAALERQGIAIVEVPLNSPQPMESIALLARAFGERLLIGAGTVMTTAQVAEIAAAGRQADRHAACRRERSCGRRSSMGCWRCPGSSLRPRRSRCWRRAPMG